MRPLRSAARKHTRAFASNARFHYGSDPFCSRKTTQTALWTCTQTDFAYPYRHTTVAFLVAECTRKSLSCDDRLFVRSTLH